jgi:diadenosine tetraphosphate (Ap4A) HIT family hydrolase
MIFQLHPQLQQDCIDIGRFNLCRLLMMNDRQYPWFILVPEKPGLQEIYQLTQTERAMLIDESSYLAENLAELYRADKMNIAAIGNLVPQLHIHHVVRYQNDKSWPSPIWGKFEAIPYSEQETKDALTRIKMQLSSHLTFS